MEFRILGSLQVVTEDGRQLRFGPRQTKVLAVLLLSAGRVLSVHDLIDAVWEGDPPATARRQIQNCVWILRKHLAILSEGPGYRILVGGGQLDAQLFEDLLAEARASAAGGQATRAAGQLTAALRLWRGPALAGSSGRAIEIGAARLNERRLSVTEQRIELELQLGHHRDLIAELTELIAHHPLRERLVGHLMLALNASGRQADALAAYQQLRTRLVNELGIDPGAEVQQLHGAILRNEAVVRRVDVVGAPVVPRQLPAPARHFVGRSTPLQELTDLVKRATSAGGTVVITAVDGTAGIGKTTLAVHWAHQVAGSFPDGQLYVNLRGFDPSGSPMTPAEAVRGFLNAFEVEPHRIPAGVDAQAALFRSMLSGRRMLVVLDNARDASQVRPLLPGSPGCFVVVTSRNRLSGLVAADGAHPLTLDLLSASEATELLIHLLGGARVTAEPEAIDEIITRCARLPLALAIVAARAASHSTFPLTTLVAELRDAHGDLDAFDGGDPATDVRTVFSWSYQAVSTTAARLFRLLGLHPGPDITAPAAASLAGVPLKRARAALTELSRAHLVAEDTPGRFGFHDLLRIFAMELARARDPDIERRTALHRMLDHYLHTAHTADRLLYPYRDPITVAPVQAGVTPEDLSDGGQALAWFVAEHPALLAIVEQAAKLGFDTHAWQLAWTLLDFFDRRGYWYDRATAQHVALDAARRLADPAKLAYTCRGLGHTYTRLGQYDAAEIHLRHAFDLYGETGDRVGQAHSHRNLSFVFEQRGRHQEALHSAGQALDLYRAAGERGGQAKALNAVGWLHAKLGDHGLALPYCQQALTLHQELGDRDGEAETWDSVGYVHHHLRQHRQAITCYQHAIDLYRDLGDRYDEAATIAFHLADTQNAAGDPDAARDSLRHALTIFDELNHPDAGQIRAKLHHLDQPAASTDTPIDNSASHTGPP
ncbi:MAG: hypothetical protein V7603_3330 [Micromonosporaceae bacterium]